MWKVLSGLFTLLLLYLIAAFLVPQLSSYASVGEALKGLDAVQLLLLLLAGFVVMTLNAAAMETPIKALRLRRAFVAQQASTAVSNVIPGPSGTAARFAILHSWKVGVEDFTRATFAVSVWSNVAMLSMPGLAFLTLALTTGSSHNGYNLYALAAVTVAASVVVILVVIFILRSVAFTRWLGRVSQRIWNALLRLVRRPGVDDLQEQAEELRRRTIEVIDDRGGRLTAITLSNYWFNGFLIVVCLWWVGIPRSALPLLVGLAVYSIGRLSTVIQITPGGVGVVEVAYTAVFVAALGEQYHSEIVTGVLVYRLLTYLLPIVVGGVCYVLWRVSRRRELDAASATTTG